MYLKNSGFMIIKSALRDYSVEFESNIKIDFKPGDFLFVDENVYRLYKSKLPKTKNIFIIKAGEKSKEFKSLHRIINALIELGFKKNNRMIVVGGATIQDACGFIASILYRGVEWHFYPTTLVAQADSCIGGKTSINFGKYKNLIGTFYPPFKIVVCDEFRSTLKEQEIRSGIGEILHYYLIAHSIQDLIWIVRDYHTMIKNPSGLICFRHIVPPLRIKRTVIEKDEFDKNERQLFNYGHTFSHGIESLSNFKLPHGLAVTLGMDMANYLAWKKGLITKQRFDGLHSLIAFNIPKFKITNIKKLIEVLSHDKKNTGKDINFILPVGETGFKKVPVKNDHKLFKIISEYAKR